MDQARLPQPVQNKTEEHKEFLPVLPQFEQVFRSYTKSEAEKQQSKINSGKRLLIFGDLIALLSKGVTIREAQKLVDSLSSISNGPKMRQDIESIASSFPDNVVESYSIKLLDNKNAFKTFKREYLKSDLRTRKDYYEELKGLGAGLTEQQLSLSIWSDANSSGTLCYPMLDFYLVLLESYERKNPQKEGATAYSELFIHRLYQFFSISAELASKSSTFEKFDAKMKDLASFELKTMALPGSSANVKR